ncbi:MAG: ribosome small subunit-dependent GTPase A [Hymenobacteraceae bacterium]|nr:ribosome small subunit-dependent GTPase A [Hymenobacteraceae bacterium]
MTLEDLGYNAALERYRKSHHLDSFEVGRVVSEHKERYTVRTAEHEYDAEITGNLRYTATQRADFPAVGDWVAVSEYSHEKALIHAVFPRTSTIERQAVGQHGEKQIIATNIDVALIVQAVDRDFNINRLERYLTICNAAKVKPIILLNKIDLVGENQLSALVDKVRERVKKVPIITMSNETLQGMEALHNMILKGNTYCLLGSSGVGKSTLLNTLTRSGRMTTGTISASTSKGKHVTTHRELIVLNSGGILIDNPGIREVGITDAAAGLESIFEQIAALAPTCKFKDCSHTTEAGCAVLEAVSAGLIDESAYENYLKMEREKAHFQSTVAERRKKDKEFGKMMKQYKKRTRHGNR